MCLPLTGNLIVRGGPFSFHCNWPSLAITSTGVEGRRRGMRGMAGEGGGGEEALKGITEK